MSCVHLLRCALLVGQVAPVPHLNLLLRGGACSTCLRIGSKKARTRAELHLVRLKLGRECLSDCVFRLELQLALCQMIASVCYALCALHCIATSIVQSVQRLVNNQFQTGFVEMKGLEPMTHALQRRCSPN